MPAKDGLCRHFLWNFTNTDTLSAAFQWRVFPAVKCTTARFPAFCHFPLCHRSTAIQPVPLHQDFRFPRSKKLLQVLVQLLRLHQRIHHFRQVGAVVNDIHQCQLVAVTVGFDRLPHIDLIGMLFLGTEVHQNFILNAPAGIGGEPCPFGAVERVHRFHQPNSADRDQFLLLRLGHAVLFDDVCHQPHIVQDQLFPCTAVAGLHRLKASLLLFFFQGLPE